MSLTQKTVDELRGHLDKVVADHIVATTTGDRAAPPQTFCSVYKKTKPFLTAAEGIVVLIPGFGATVAAALAALVTIGDEVCPGS